MSSLVKKGSQFAPKLKNPVRKKANPKATATPEPSQKSQSSASETRTKPLSDQLDTPPTTQVVKPRTSFSIKGTINRSVALDDAVDPIDDSKPQDSAIADSSDEEDEALKEHAQSLRRASSRRLSGINPGFRSRSASVSHRPGHEDTQSAAARIVVPQPPKTGKRRRSSVSTRNTKRASVAAPVTAPALKPSSVVPVPTAHNTAHSPSVPSSSSSSSTTTTSRILNSNVSHLFPALRKSAAPLSMIMNEPEAGSPPSPLDRKEDVNIVSKEFVVGIDPRTNKLRKFRRPNAPKPEIKQEDGFTRVADEPLDDLVPIAPDNLVTTVTSISQIPSGIKDEDLELYGELNFNYEGMTMADLCKPTLKIGDVSSSFKLAQEAEAQLKQKKMQRKLDRIRARQERISLEEATLKNEGKTDEEIQHEKEGKKAKRGPDVLNFEEEAPSSSSALQLTLVDGKIGYNEESAVVVKPRADASGRTVEDSNPFANPVTSTTYSKRTYTDKWTPDELNEFYQALSMFGTDFSLISQLYPHRTRKQIKSKFVLEERKYPEVIELALKRKLPVDFKKYCEATNNEIKTIEQYNEELKKVRLEHEQSMNAIAIEREKAFKEDAEANRRREIEIRTGFTGSKAMTTAERRKELRKNETVVGTIDDIKHR
ncbi:hypothetical protein CANMA_002947 [Candida margitis]|uniref:uncharacterized protein n=1 Tax=Candida margitis TaxID=1775924 RepID=UPI0022277109|nr:uncharacterized protein CANMA_002947 [Candida margitis]KAI5967767.1 hypothetical protein CANMA_002947 [Candida margitis]